jgi:hypothetical protein
MAEWIRADAVVKGLNPSHINLFLGWFEKWLIPV